MKPVWFKPRGYKHFDAPVGAGFIPSVLDPAFVKGHSWSPLIYTIRRTKRYKPTLGKTVFKNRPIMYASHRDACILAKYAHDLNQALDQFYESEELSENVIAYRKLGKTNYHFSAEAYRFARKHMPCVVLCFDISGFFDNLDHGILKDRLKRILGVHELEEDWYRVFRHVTRYRFVPLSTLKAHPIFAGRLSSKSREPIATVRELKEAGIIFERNPNCRQIPQGTPISSAFSNLYMIDLDTAMKAAIDSIGGLYQRYSDDIILICGVENEAEIVGHLHSTIEDHRLEIQPEKTERTQFGPGNSETFQYLGFNIDSGGAVIRPGSLSRQWKKAKRSIARTRKAGKAAMEAGHASKVYTAKLRRRFQPVGVRNFSRYARRAAGAFGSKRILRQIRKWERMVDKAIRDLNPKL